MGLNDPAADPTRGSLVMQSPPAFAVRQGKWKPALTPSSGSRGMWGTKPVPEQAWGAALRAFGGTPAAADLRRAPFVQLFDLEADIGKTQNPAAAHPKIAAQIVALLDEQIAAGAAPRERSRQTTFPRSQRIATRGSGSSGSG